MPKNVDSVFTDHFNYSGLLLNKIPSYFFIYYNHKQ